MTKKINALEFCQETIKQKRSIEASWIELSARIKEIRDKKLYAGMWENFEEFLASPEMEMDKGTASKMISIHEKLVLGLKLKPEALAEAGGWSKISEVLPVINTLEEANDWLSKCENLSKDDLRKEVRRVRHLDEGGADCKHEDTYDLHLRVCRDCADKEVIKSTE